MVFSKMIELDEVQMLRHQYYRDSRARVGSDVLPRYRHNLMHQCNRLNKDMISSSKRDLFYV